MATYYFIQHCFSDNHSCSALLCVCRWQVSAALDEAGAARKAAEQQLKQAQQAVKDAETAYRQKVAAR